MGTKGPFPSRLDILEEGDAGLSKENEDSVFYVATMMAVTLKRWRDGDVQSTYHQSSPLTFLLRFIRLTVSSRHAELAVGADSLGVSVGKNGGKPGGVFPHD